MMRLFDTHTHFDVEDFDVDRQYLAEQSYKVGVKGLILIGFLANRFQNLLLTQQQLTQWNNVPKSYLAPGLHPFYIDQHQKNDLNQLEQFLKMHSCLAIGEIGLDFFEKQHKTAEIKQQQQDYFHVQLELAQQHNLPVLLHIRKAHGDVLSMLKQHKFRQGGIAHAFSGGLEEAKAFTKLGFKIGITGQITNPNAKRLHTVVHSLGAEHLVLETDCPDMTPLCCQVAHQHRTRNTPVNLPYVLEGLAHSLNLDSITLSEILWRNSVSVLNIEK